MHPNPLLDPLFWEHVLARQQELLCAARSAAQSGVAALLAWARRRTGRD